LTKIKAENKNAKQIRGMQVFEVFKTEYPVIRAFLLHETPFQLLIATMLSAQCTDKRVNQVTPALFRKYPTPTDLGNACLENIEAMIQSVNYFRSKAKNIQSTAKIIASLYQDHIPNTLSELVKLPGVGRKTANVVLGAAFNHETITVDTHVKRLTQRLGFTSSDTPEKIESDLQTLWPEWTWSAYSSYLISHGRATCFARKPLCAQCKVNNLCPSRRQEAK